ncbi:MAG: Lysophospholipase, partial [Labilithrix sp.]|nr:Lysophospholipase [Labilithrix sp.]
FVRGETTAPGGPEMAWALSDAWGKNAPLTSEPFWKDERLVVRKPTDVPFRAAVRNVFGEMMRDLEPWPAATYDAIDLGEYLRAHPELGSGDWLVVTNARGEQLVLSRSEIDRKKPVIVVGIDDERNLFRLFVTYNVHRTYSWKPETDPRPLLVRHIGAFLHVPGGAEGLHVATLADFALTTSSFHLTDEDPLATARTLPKPVVATLTNEQGCLQCHALRGEGARAHHLRASDGKIAEAHGLALEEYPRDVLTRFLFDQDAVSKSFGVGALHVDEATAKQLFAEVSR